MFDKDKVEKNHYHYRYVCCIGYRSTNNSSSIEKARWQDSQRIKNKETSDIVLISEGIPEL